MRLADLTIAIRNLARRPGFACTAILLLALGSGANAAVFSVVRGVLLKPLPFERPEELVDFWPGWFVSNEEIGYWREHAPYIASLSGISPGWMMALVADGVEPLKVTAGRVADNFFSTLGVRAVLGRTLQPGDSNRDRSRVAVISSELHARHFGSDPRILGRSIRLDNVVHEIVGVMPRGFEFMEPGTDVWAPLVFDPTSPQHRATFNRAVARLAPGVTPERASQELQALIPAMHRDLAKTGQWGRGIHVRSLQDSVATDVRLTLLILLGAVGMVLLMAAVNLGTLAMGRSIARAREMAVRTALGASRGRLIRQLIVEHIVLAAAGAIAGLLLAWMALPILTRAIPPEMPRQSAIALDLTVFGLVFAASVGVSALLALVPASVAARPELQPLLRQQQSGETPARRRTMGTLVAAQIALAVILGIGASLLMRSLWNLQRVDPGFDAARVLTFRLQTTSKYNALGAGSALLRTSRGAPTRAARRDARRLDSTSADDRLQLDERGPSGRAAATAWRGAAACDLAHHRVGLLPGDGDPHGRGTCVQRAGPSQVGAGRDRQRHVRTARIRQRLERDRPADGQHRRTRRGYGRDRGRHR